MLRCEKADVRGHQARPNGGRCAAGREAEEEERTAEILLPRLRDQDDMRYFAQDDMLWLPQYHLSF